MILEICRWLEATTLGTALRESSLMFPMVEGTHLLALGVSVGTLFISDLRLMGVVFRDEPASEVMGQLLPWSLGGFAVMVVTGLLLFWSEPVRVYESPWFRLKLLFLLLAGLNAIVFHGTIYLRMSEWDRDPVPPRAARIAGVLSLILWGLVITAGRTTAYKL